MFDVVTAQAGVRVEAIHGFAAELTPWKRDRIRHTRQPRPQISFK